IIDVRNVNILDFKELLESKLCILHNSKFDYKMLKLEGIILERIYDVMLAESVLTTGYKNISLSLKDVLGRYLSIPMEKETRNKFITIGNLPFTAEMVKYAATDVMYLQMLKEMQLIKIVKEELEYCVNLENNVVKALADVEFNGVYLDENLWRE